jgi:hypothetical protein
MYRIALIACALYMLPATAFARGGPAGVFAALLEVSIAAAIVLGLVGGVLNGLRKPNSSWVLVPVSLIALFALALSPPLFVFFGTPVLIFLAIFAVTSDIERTGLFKSPGKASSRFSQVHVKWLTVAGFPGIARYMVIWLGGTYFFWAVVSLCNLELLAVLAAPPLIFLSPQFIGKYLSFIVPPLTISIVVGLAACITYFFLARGKGSGGYLAPFMFNAFVLVVFLMTANAYKNHLIAAALLGHQPRNLYVISFPASVLGYKSYFRSPHASFEENGEYFLWSYSERKFVAVPK